jgi:hypothetical protein
MAAAWAEWLAEPNRQPLVPEALLDPPVSG